MTRQALYILFLISIALAPASIIAAKFDSVSPTVAKTRECLSCHEKIERSFDSAMTLAIEGMGKAYNDPGGCVVCHGRQCRAKVRVDRL